MNHDKQQPTTLSQVAQVAELEHLKTAASETAEAPALTRRDFLGLAGTGLFVFVAAEALPGQEPARLPARAQGYPTDFNAYLRIAENGRVTCMVGKVELGQGAMTSLAQLLAEELDVPLDTVDMIMGDTDLCPWDMGTFGSLSVRQFGPVLRAAAAEARAVLVQLASEHLKAAPELLQIKGAVVSHAKADTRVSYGELVAGKRIERHIDKVPLKPVAAYTIVGKSPARKDGLDKVTGDAKFAGDISLPGMLHARIVRPPAHGATLKTINTAEAEKIAGVKVIRDGDLVAVLHQRRDVADKALALVTAEFDRPPANVDERNIFEHLLKNVGPAQTLHEAGSLAEGEKQCAALFERTYLNSYVAHAPIETHSATAKIENGKATVWAGTQTPFPTRNQVAQTLGLAPQEVRVITPYVGGGFGGKSASRQAVEAARLAKLAGVPVQVVWDRREEFFYDTFRPAAVVKIRSGLTREGKIALWDYAVYCAGEREARQFYDVPNQRTVSAGGWGGSQGRLHPFAIGPWRAPGVSTQTFARESHIDLLAEKAGVDPVQFRMAHLDSNPRLRRTLEAAAKQFGWKPGKAPSGRGVGVACGTDTGSWVATMAEVGVDKATGHVQVKRVVCAQDNGVTVSPDGARQQMEGCITMGLGYALTEEVRFRGGDVLDHNFDSYELPRFSWLPEIETVLIDNTENPSSGCGEPAVVTMGAVIANAIYDAIGVRLWQLPMTPERIKSALKNV